MKTYQAHLILILLGSVLYSIGDVVLKLIDFDELLQFSSEFSIIPFLLFGIALGLTLVAKIVIGKVLSDSDLGYTQALFIAISILITSSLGILIFEELITIKKIVGYLFLILGTLLIIKHS